MLLPHLLLLPLLAPSAPPAVAADDGQRLSLEELLERYRARRDERLGALRDQVAALLAELDTTGPAPRPSEAAAAAERLRALGPVSAPLLVPGLDPGPDADDGRVFRAQLVARVLREMPNYALTDDLLELLISGTRAGQQNALRVLGRSEDPGRVGPALRAYHEQAKGPRRDAALVAIAELGGADGDAYVGTQLASDDPETVRAALVAAAAARSATLAGRVLELVRARTVATAQVRELEGYYRACPQTVDEDAAEALLALARAPRTASADAVRLIDLLGDFQKAWSSSLKRDLKTLADSGDRQVAEAALIALVKSGDRGAKRDLLAPYDERVAESERWARAYEERGDVYYRIEDWKSAKKDYEEALRRGADSSRSQADVHVQVARCWARMGKLKDAKEWLEKAPITLGQLRALALDPAFSELAGHPRYSEVFRLE